MSSQSTGEFCERRAPYWICGQRIEAGTVAFAEAVAAAHATQQHPLCLCQDEGVEMYIARLPGTSDAYVVKRMPDTGSRHAPHCPSYEPPPEASGLGEVLGSAITEDPATGETTLKLDFALSKIAGRSTQPVANSQADSVAGKGARLSLRSLLHYLWDQAELTRWHPGFEGRRKWATVRKHLLLAADNKVTHGNRLRSLLYIPEPFWAEERDAINGRRRAQWDQIIAAPGRPRQLMLVIAEVKELVPARYGFKLMAKHLPDQGFALDALLYRRTLRRFASELALWGAAEDVRLIAITTFGVVAAGIPTIHELSLMLVTRQWLPIEDCFERDLVERLVADGRRFVKGLRYNLGVGQMFASATLTDCEGAAPMLFIDAGEADIDPVQLEAISARDHRWVWCPHIQPMPELPARK